RTGVSGGERFEHASTAGVHYRLNYLTPYWDPEGGFKLDLVYQGGVGDLDKTLGIHGLSGEIATGLYLPDLSRGTGSVAGPALRWLADTRLALRLYGAMGLPTRGVFFTMGGGELFRGFDLSERQGSTVWVGSAEWRVPLAKGLTWDVCDHI